MRVEGASLLVYHGDGTTTKTRLDRRQAEAALHAVRDVVKRQGWHHLKRPGSSKAFDMAVWGKRQGGMSVAELATAYGVSVQVIQHALDRMENGRWGEVEG